MCWIRRHGHSARDELTLFWNEEGKGNVVVQWFTKLGTGMTQGMRGEHGVSAGKSEKKNTFDTHVDGWILL